MATVLSKLYYSGDLVGARNWNLHNTSWGFNLTGYCNLLSVQFTALFETAFMVLKASRVWRSVASSRERHSWECGWHCQKRRKILAEAYWQCPERWKVSVEVHWYCPKVWKISAEAHWHCPERCKVSVEAQCHCLGGRSAFFFYFW